MTCPANRITSESIFLSHFTVFSSFTAPYLSPSFFLPFFSPYFFSSLYFFSFFSSFLLFFSSSFSLFFSSSFSLFFSSSFSLFFPPPSHYFFPPPSHCLFPPLSHYSILQNSEVVQDVPYMSLFGFLYHYSWHLFGGSMCYAVVNFVFFGQVRQSN